MRTRILLFLLLFGLLAAPSLAKPEDPLKTFLKEVGKDFKRGDSAAIAARFPSEGKIELRLQGIQAGRYRDAQARSLLATYFSKIEPKEYKLKEFRPTVGTFKSKYRVREDGTRVEGVTRVYLERKGETWLIVGIVES